MKNRNIVLPLLLLLLFFVAFFIRRWNEPKEKEAFDRHPEKLQYTRHALCRMKCRFISKEEIAEIMQKGVINFSKSDPKDRPCPTYAIQGRTGSGEYLRVVFAQCSQQTKVITCYNMEEDFTCHCPGDEAKKHH